MTDASTETRARNIIKRLKIFNRKERDHLMKFALCEKPEEPEISENLWTLISRDNGTKSPAAANFFMGMDYHLNWIHAALVISEIKDIDSISELKNEWRCTGPSDKDNKNFRPIQENQQDVDLLVAWIDSRWKRPLRFIFIEAKLDSGWKPDQLTSKRERLDLIRKDAGARGLDFIDWRFLLLSPASTVIPEQETSEGFYSVCEWNGIASDRRQVKRVSGSFEKWEIV